MPVPLLLPRQGNTVESCVIVRWLKPPGAEVREGEPVVEVETDKAVMEIESPATGIMLELLFPEGAHVEVLKPMALIGLPGEGPVPPGSLKAPPARAESPPPPPALERKPALASGPQSRVQIATVSPRAAGLASASGVDLAFIAGTGPQGRIIERDVAAALARGQEKSSSAESSPGSADPASDVDAHRAPASPTSRSLPAGSSGPCREVIFTSTRRLIAERLRQSLEKTAQLTLQAAADITGLIALRRRLNARRLETGQPKYSINDFVLLAVSRVLPEYRGLNAHGLADRRLEFESVHLGMAVDTPRGLMVPVIRFAERLDLETLADEARRLARACREGSIRTEQLQGGTFTVTNLGAFGIETFTPILNPPEVGILGVGGIQYRPHPEHPAVPVPHLLFSLTFDHRALDGAPAARFLGRLAEALAHIDRLEAGTWPEAGAPQ